MFFTQIKTKDGDEIPCVIMATQLQVLFLLCFTLISAGEAFLVPLWLHIDLGQNYTLQIRNLLACYGESRCCSRSKRQMNKGPSLLDLALSGRNPNIWRSVQVSCVSFKLAKAS